MNIPAKPFDMLLCNGLSCEFAFSIGVIVLSTPCRLQYRAASSQAIFERAAVFNYLHIMSRRAVPACFWSTVLLYFNMKRNCGRKRAKTNAQNMLYWSTVPLKIQHVDNQLHSSYA
eukprot:3472359-Pleurochrysis_carterae.AAC.2